MKPSAFWLLAALAVVAVLAGLSWRASLAFSGGMPTLAPRKPKGGKIAVNKAPASKGGKPAVSKVAKPRRVKNLPVGAIVLDDDFFAMQTKFGGDTSGPC